MEDRVVLEVRRQIGDDAQAAVEVVDVVVIGCADAGQVLDEAVALIALHRDANLEGIGQRNVERALEALLVIVAIRALDETFEAIVRLGRSQQHGTARRVATEQSALWALEHLDVLQIDESAGANGITRSRAALRT